MVTTLPKVCIRPLQALRDGAALAALYESVFDRGKAGTVVSDIHWRAAVQPPLKSAPVDVAKEITARENYGFVCESAQGHVLGAVTLFSNPHQPSTIILANLVTDTRVRRRGVGRCLVEHVVRFARQQGVQHLALQVDSDNAAAIGLYHAQGFEYLGQVHAMCLTRVDSRFEAQGSNPFREARGADADELARLVQINIPATLRYADVVPPERFRPAANSILKRAPSSSWFVADGSKGKLKIAIKIDSAGDSMEPMTHILFDPALDFETGQRLAQMGLTRLLMPHTAEIRINQSVHALIPMRIVKALGFQTERTLLHMRKTLR
ncbi:MAG: GNAT family N-acetyltransferase [Anaerolineae bacterium]|nr:GNAT family N-acetyltransferase [Anaerolineae bacterium]